jgi:hypothetical protein
MIGPQECLDAVGGDKSKVDSAISFLKDMELISPHVMVYDCDLDVCVDYDESIHDLSDYDGDEVITWHNIDELIDFLSMMEKKDEK